MSKMTNFLALTLHVCNWPPLCRLSKSHGYNKVNFYLIKNLWVQIARASHKFIKKSGFKRIFIIFLSTESNVSIASWAFVVHLALLTFWLQWDCFWKMPNQIGKSIWCIWHHLNQVMIQINLLHRNLLHNK